MIMSPSDMKDALTQRRSSYEMFEDLGYYLYCDHYHLTEFIKEYAIGTNGDRDVFITLVLKLDAFEVYAVNKGLGLSYDAVLSIEELRAIATWYKERGIDLYE